MNTLLAILLVAAMGATLFMLKSDAAGPSASGVKQNKAMMGRIFFQAVAVLIAALLMVLAR